MVEKANLKGVRIVLFFFGGGHSFTITNTIL